MRLNAFLAQSGVASRRKADELIKAGRVTINGTRAELNSVVAGDSVVMVDGKPVAPQKFRYILLNKPRGTVTTARDTHGRKTVVELVDISERVVPVGRLDYHTTGALLLTNDGDLAYKLTHPKFEIDKVYEAKVKGKVTDEILNKLSIGIRLEDGLTAPAKAKKISENKIELILHEGRKHQVKRMMSAVGLQVISLHRSQYGPLNLRALRPGQWRELKSEELKQLKMVQ